MNRIAKAAIIVAVVGAAGYFGWRYQQDLRAERAMQGIASGNGRIEAVEIDVAARTAGRLSDILVKEGNFVKAGAIVARMDIEQLVAQKREAEAQLARAKIAIETAKSLVVQRQAEKEAAAATVSQNEVQLQSARKRLTRSEQMSRSGSVSEQLLDDDRARVEGGVATVSAAKANLAATDAAIGAAQSQVVDAGASVEAVQATVARIDADLRDSELKAPRDGRVQYLVAQPGEVVAAGGRVLNILDVGDVYMTFFLPTGEAGRTPIGGEARIVLDAAPQYVIPARISFVSDVAQFTPKTVETEEERQKLMFRLRARVSPELLQKYIAQVKTGLPGRTYVKLDPAAEWPAALSRPITP
ncbi:HlyD family efflux transporter periplasmic adaptor subunit [Neorhizobium sp. BETTINA12A]|uniref:HlyD family secretion protein n=1 Tax=Neorhizobium sp. BETTINA12A TaxID=2908924 RepID=UPI001FF6880C|nr:HlyD family efflux transporter periplasmic adaptor subunit [Neorhizobium sp. BETTINA12A]MCJ9750697.1 HlyD family efflux transporter periplasmic adaptor subunit [Neorhizobium sp. BETTINA12A]